MDRLDIRGVCFMVFAFNQNRNGFGFLKDNKFKKIQINLNLWIDLTWNAQYLNEIPSIQY